MSLLKAASKQPFSHSPLPGSNTRVGLWFAIAISIAFHIAVFYNWVDNKTSSLSLGQARFSALIVAPDTQEKQHRKTIPAKKPASHTKTVSVVKPESKKLATTNSIIPLQSAESLQEQTRRSQNAVRGNIQSQLSQYLSYPEFARRKGWQGIVVVTLKVNNSGQLKDIHVNSSSGFDILDNTAIDALNKLNAIEIKQEFKLALNTSLEIPIHFKLQGS